MIRAAVIASSLAARVGLRVLLAADETIEVIGEGALLDDLQHAPLTDAHVAVVQGLPPVASFKPPESLRGMLFVVDDRSDLIAPDLAMPWGMLPAESRTIELSAAVTALHSGLIVVHPDLASRLIARSATADEEPPVEPLTGRELEVLQLIGQGLANKMIADRLHISEHTVKFHISSIYAKLGVASRTEAVRAGARRGLIVL